MPNHPTIVRMKGLTDTDYANAALIAAAPDLLEALKQLAHQYQHVLGEDLCVHQARAAIAKAEGKSEGE